MVRMLFKRLNCVTLGLSNTLSTYVLKLHIHGVHCYKTSSREASKRRAKRRLYRAAREIE